MIDFILRTRDGISLAAAGRRPSPQRRSAVVVVPGFTGSKDDPQVVELAEALTGDGHGVITYDARGHHASGGLCTLGDDEWMDVAAAVAAARDVADEVVTVGTSMGGIAVLRHAAHDPHLTGVITVSSPSSWQMPRNPRVALSALLTRTAFGRWFAARRLGVRVHPHWSNPPSPRSLARTLQIPLVAVHGGDDPMIPPISAEELVDAASTPTRLEIVPGMRHGFDPAGIPAILAAVAWVLDLNRVAPASP